MIWDSFFFWCWWWKAYPAELSGNTPRLLTIRSQMKLNSKSRRDGVVVFFQCRAETVPGCLVVDCVIHVYIIFFFMPWNIALYFHSIKNIIVTWTYSFGCLGLWLVETVCLDSLCTYSGHIETVCYPNSLATHHGACLGDIALEYGLSGRQSGPLPEGRTCQCQDGQLSWKLSWTHEY